MYKNIVKFFKETKQEALKVTWPSRKETTTTTTVVFIMIFVMSIILLAADSLISVIVKFILSLGA